MLITEHFAFTDMPKTGTTYLAKILNSGNNHRREYVETPTYSAYRDPVDWYNSWMSFIINGCEINPNSKPCPLACSLQNKYDCLSISVYLDVLLCNDIELKREISKDVQIKNTNSVLFGNHFLNDIISKWLKTSDQDLYSYSCDYYLKGTTVLPFSRLDEAITEVFTKHNYSHNLNLDEVNKNRTSQKITFKPHQIDMIREKTKDAVSKYYCE